MGTLIIYRRTYKNVLKGLQQLRKEKREHNYAQTSGMLLGDLAANPLKAATIYLEQTMEYVTRYGADGVSGILLSVLSAGRLLNSIQFDKALISLDKLGPGLFQGPHADFFMYFLDFEAGVSTGKIDNMLNAESLKDIPEEIKDLTLASGLSVQDIRSAYSLEKLFPSGTGTFALTGAPESVADYLLTHQIVSTIINPHADGMGIAARTFTERAMAEYSHMRDKSGQLLNDCGGWVLTAGMAIGAVIGSKVGGPSGAKKGAEIGFNAAGFLLETTNICGAKTKKDGEGSSGSGSTDGGATDGGATDGGATDGGTTEAGTTDASPTSAGVTENPETKEEINYPDDVAGDKPGEQPRLALEQILQKMERAGKSRSGISQPIDEMGTCSWLIHGMTIEELSYLNPLNTSNIDDEIHTTGEGASGPTKALTLEEILKMAKKFPDPRPID